MKALPLILALALTAAAVRADEPPKPAAPAIKVATFDVDATPPLGSAMA